MLVLVCSSAFSQENSSREFRGVWVATAYQIDWPKEGRMTSSQQKEDFIEILDFYRSLNFTAVFVQVRTGADAFYESEYAPWSEYLSGVEGDKGDWEEDPMAFMVEATKARGMEFHAWLNPFRATLGGNPALLADGHIYKEHPEWCVRYGRSLYLDPGKPEVRAHVVDVVAEIINKYDVDGIHFDDYFYPYPIKGSEFDDRMSFLAHGLGDFQEREDWRRANIDSLMHDIHEIMDEKDTSLKFGVSPFGIWRNKSNDQRAPEIERTISTYDHLYADPLTWMREGWVDYLVPQVYWRTTHSKDYFEKVASWWNDAAEDIPVYLGNAVYDLEKDDPRFDEGREIASQVLFGRALSKIQGHVFFSARSLMRRPDLARKLRTEVYQLGSSWSQAD